MRLDTIGDMEDDDPDWTAHLNRMSPDERRELEEMDAGRFMCIDCGEFVAPDGSPVHTGCTSPRARSEHPVGLVT